MLCPNIDNEHYFCFLFEQERFLFIFCNNGCYIMMSYMLVYIKQWNYILDMSNPILNVIENKKGQKEIILNHLTHGIVALAMQVRDT